MLFDELVMSLATQFSMIVLSWRVAAFALMAAELRRKQGSRDAEPR